jgi:sensor histidine kinase regulating citrate/malate metabolism
MKKSRLKRGQSTVVAEILLLVMVLILSSTVVLTMRSNMSYYTQSRELVSIYLWTSQNDNEVNFTAIHCGVDAVKVHGQITFTNSTGAEKTVTANVFYNGTLSPVLPDGTFEISQFKFGENATVIADLTGLANGTIHYVLSSRSQILAKVDKET